MNFNSNKTELQTSTETNTRLDVLKNIQDKNASNDADYDNAEVQTSEKPKSESCVGKVEEVSNNSEVLTSGILTYALMNIIMP